MTIDHDQWALSLVATGKQYYKFKAGLGVQVGPKGNKKWVKRYRDRSGNERSVTICDVQEMKSYRALARADDIISDLLTGDDESARRRLNTNGVLFGTAKGDYIDSAGMREISVRNTEWIANRYLESWSKKPVREITRRDCFKLYEKVQAEVKQNRGTSGVAQANEVLGLVQRIWDHADITGLDPTLEEKTNPASRIKRKPKPAGRKDHIKPNQADMTKYWMALNAHPSPVMRGFFMFLTVAGTRAGETKTLRWDRVNWKDRMIHIPADETKSDRELNIPMTDLLERILRNAMKFRMGGEYVFPGRATCVKDGARVARNAHLSSYKKAWVEIMKEADLGYRVLPHGLRRTYVTVGTTLGIEQHAIKRIVNHADHSRSGNVTDRYIQDVPEEQRKICERIAAEFARLCSIDDFDSGVREINPSELASQALRH